MFLLLKALQSLVRALHSDGSPTQVAAGIALGAALGLTPLLSLHNLVVVAVLMLTTASIPGGMLGWVATVPLGFALDPLFDRLGRWLLLDVPALTPLWTSWYNTPIVPYTSFNNSVVLGSVVAWLVLAGPIFAGARLGVIRYRATLGERVRRSKLYRAVTASRVYNVYKLFRPS